MYLDNHIQQIQKLCKQHKVKTLSVFGSVLNENFSKSSDIDMVIDIDSDDPFEYAEHYFDFKFQLEALLGRKIDLLEKKALNNRYLIRSIEKSKKTIYGAEN